MGSDNRLREQICLLAKSMFDRGLTGGSTGNISARTEDGGLLVSPTGTSFGRLDPARLALIDKSETGARSWFQQRVVFALSGANCTSGRSAGCVGWWAVALRAA